MKRLVILLALSFIVTGEAQAQQNENTGLGLNTVVSPGELKATPEMWFYDQAMRLYSNPKMMVRLRAEYRAWQRSKRLASRRWFGLSNARPQASADPYNGDYSARWTANPGFFPDRWNGVGQGGTYYVR